MEKDLNQPLEVHVRLSVVIALAGMNLGHSVELLTTNTLCDLTGFDFGT